MQIQVVSALRQTNQDQQVLDLLAQEARQLFAEQSAAVAALASRVDEGYGRAVQLVLGISGHVIVTGIGKSGLIGQKVAATLASTGTPSFFVHATEALHGDLGMVTSRDCVLIISYSGETEEILQLMPHLEARGVPTVALVGNMASGVASMVDVALDVSVHREVCPNNLAPTNSTLATLAMGDALAVSLMRMRDFRAEDFARLHPGGRLGRRLHTRVRDVMHAEDLPIVSPQDTVRDCLLTAARGRLGITLVVERGRLRGVVTAAELESVLSSENPCLDAQVADIMGARPPVIDQNAWLAEAELRHEQERADCFVVVDTKGYLVGVLVFPIE